MPRKIDPCGRSLPDFRVEADLPAGLLGEAKDHRQAEASSLAGRLGRVEGIERSREDVRGHATPTVGDTDRDILTGRHVLLARGRLINPRVRRLDRNAPPVRHGVSRIDAEIQDGAFKLVWIAQARPEARCEDGFDGYGGADRASNQLVHS